MHWEIFLSLYLVEGLPFVTTVTARARMKRRTSVCSANLPPSSMVKGTMTWGALCPTAIGLEDLLSVENFLSLVCLAAYHGTIEARERTGLR
jgi:hypothetical protein